jgi:hypothetical protein
MVYESKYYGTVNLGDSIMHYGVKGQKWGIRRYQNADMSLTPEGRIHYGIGQGKRKGNSVYKNQVVNDLLKSLNTDWEYGVIYNGKHINTESENFDWSKYRTLPVKTLSKEKIGTCWDFVNYQHKILSDAGIENDAFLVMMDLRTKEEPDRIVTHTFTTCKLDGKEYWLESAMWPKRGLHEIKSFEDAAKEVASVYSENPKPYSLFKYNPDGMDAGLTGDEFIDKATDGTWLGDYNTDKKKRS